MVLNWPGQKRRREEKSKEEEEKKGEGGEEEDQGIFGLELSVFWILRVFGRKIPWRIIAPLSRVLEEITQILDIC